MSLPCNVLVCVVSENWRFSKLVRVKGLPVTVRVRSVDECNFDVDLTGHKLRLIAVSDAVFLRANAINNGMLYTTTTIVVVVYYANKAIHNIRNENPTSIRDYQLIYAVPAQA